MSYLVTKGKKKSRKSSDTHLFHGILNYRSILYVNNNEVEYKFNINLDLNMKIILSKLFTEVVILILISIVR